ncbi:MAG: LapA family protein [Alphaproteobacteria bacterium PRO2]|nr:LapA family protein [Alphaproteobacteria bacterium PRO2]
MGFIRGIIGLAFAVLFAIFAVANRQSVDIVWHPVLPPVSFPLYIVALGLLAIGFILGGFMAWLKSIPVRVQKTVQSRKIRKLEKELGAAKEKETKESLVSKLPPATTTPAEPAVRDWNALPRNGTDDL